MYVKGEVCRNYFVAKLRIVENCIHINQLLGKQKQKTFIRSEADIIEKLKNTAVKFNDLEADFEGKK